MSDVRLGPRGDAHMLIGAKSCPLINKHRLPDPQPNALGRRLLVGEHARIAGLAPAIAKQRRNQSKLRIALGTRMERACWRRRHGDRRRWGHGFELRVLGTRRSKRRQTSQRRPRAAAAAAASHAAAAEHRDLRLLHASDIVDQRLDAEAQQVARVALKRWCPGGASPEVTTPHAPARVRVIHLLHIG